MPRHSQALYNHYLLYGDSLEHHPKFDDIQKEIADYISDKKFRYNKTWGRTHKLLVPDEKAIIDDEYFDVDLMDKDWLEFQILDHLPLFKKQIIFHLKEHIKDYYLNLNFDQISAHKKVKKVFSDLSLHSSWMTSFSGRDYTHAHHHIDKDAVFAGVYYYFCPPIVDPADQRAGSISFLLEPNITNTWPLDFAAPTECNVKPKTGQIIFFPADLLHQVNASLTDKVRYSISFNIKTN